MYLLFLSTLLLGTLLRFVALNQSFWLDEAITANVVSNLSFSQIINQFSPTDFHPPGFYLFLKLWSSVFGISEISLRLPSIIFSLITAILIFLFIKKVSNLKTAFLASAFYYFNPLIIYYSQEARVYSLLVLLFVVCLISLLQRKILLFNIFVFLSLFFFYGSIFYLVPMYLYLVYRRDFKFVALSVFTPLIFLLIFGRLVLTQLDNSHQLLSQIPNWSQVLGRLDPKNLFLIPIKLVIGRISFLPKIAYWATALLASIFIYSIVALSSLKHFKYFYFLISSIIVAIIFSFLTGGGLQYFRLIFSVPLISILLAFFLSQHQKLSYLTFLIFISFSLSYLLIPRFHREDWRTLLQDLPQNSTVYMIKSFSDPLIYYRPDLTVVDTRFIPTSSASEILVLPYGEEIHQVDHRQFLSAFTLTFTKTSNQLSLETWRYSYPSLTE